MRPASGSSTPASRRSSVDLPAPFGPTSPIRARGGTTRPTARRTTSAPYDFETPAATSEPARRDMRNDLQRLGGTGSDGAGQLRIKRRRAPPRSLATDREDEHPGLVLDDADVRAVVRRDVRRRQHLGSLALGDDGPAVEQNEPFRVLPGEREVVHRRHDRQSVAIATQRVDELEHELLAAEVER